MLQTPPGSRTTSPVPVNTPVHRASRRIRGLPPEAEADVTELQKAAAPPLPTVSSIASIIKDELHQALRDPVTLDNTTAVPTEYRRATYAEALKRPASSPPLFVHAPPTVSLQSAQQLQYCEDTRTSPPFVYAGPVAHRSEQPSTMTQPEVTTFTRQLDLPPRRVSSNYIIPRISVS
ncbi:hypothetical protein HPB52_022478 [Rhipicephalus sanguineus]|uniref:Uncharacterized protein n=1 Tax=Rhipicephalus sanguineus TaxID=34632 RepID=A0A9D4Q3A6_RHISA|nr:hypothetical protein HPB52_022478 [Rhipicephalus sanguineus]